MTLQAQQPMVNVVRVALQALAAVAGGCQSLHTNSYDEALGLPTQEAVTIALRTQQVIAYESGAADVVDPLAGSYAVEALTHRIEAGARAYLARVDAMGGMTSAIEQGYVQREIQASAYRYQLEIEEKKRIIVGQNEFVSDAPVVSAMKIDPRVEREQVERTRAWRAAHQTPEKAEALGQIDAAAKGADNLLPPTLAAVKAGATVGEISDVLRGVWGEHQETLTV